MTKLREVSTLLLLCIRRFGAIVVSMRSKSLSDHQYYRYSGMNCDIWPLENEDTNGLAYILESDVPSNLCQFVANQVLFTIKYLLVKNDISDLEALKVTRIVMNAKVKYVNLFCWPPPMWKFFYENLSQMNNLESLTLEPWSLEWGTSLNQNLVLKALESLLYLRSISLHFHCNDKMLKEIAKSCPHIISIDVYLSRLVTDRSVYYLLRRPQLQKLQLIGTSVSESGYAILISNLQNLKSIGLCDNLELVVRYLNTAPYNNIKTVVTRNMTNRTLGFLSHCFPKVERLFLVTYTDQTTDLTALVYFENLKELFIGWVPLDLISFNQALKIAGHNLTHLHLDNLEAILSNSVTIIGNSCPNLISLLIINSVFVDEEFLIEPPIKLQPHFFKMLKFLFWVVEDSPTLLELILSNAVQIKHIHVGYHSGLQHFNLVNILEVNAMKFLKELFVWYSEDMSMETVKLLLASCPNLIVLSELQNWNGISEEEWKAFKESIKKNNFDLYIGPTWVSCPRCCHSYLNQY